MKYELTEESEINSKIDNSAVIEDANVDKAIPIYLKKERKTNHIRKY